MHQRLFFFTAIHFCYRKFSYCSFQIITVVLMILLYFIVIVLVLIVEIKLYPCLIRFAGFITKFFKDSPALQKIIRFFGSNAFSLGQIKRLIYFFVVTSFQ